MQTSRDKGAQKTFVCNRSGAYCSSANLRAEKARGSIKTNKICPSFISYKKESSDQIIAVYQIKHHSHKKYYHTIPPKIRKEVYELLNAGVGPKNILKRINGKYNQFNFEQKHIMNIKRKWGIQMYIFNPNDLVSVKIYKQQFKERFLYLTLPDNKNDSTQICIFPGIKNIILPEKSLLAMDSNHKTTFYGFYLTTLGYIDINKKLHIISWLISSNEKQSTLSRFVESSLQHVKMPKQIGLITDDTPIYENSFKNSYNGELNHILCRWHLEKNFKKYARKYSGNFFSKSLWHFNRLVTSQTKEELRDRVNLFKNFCSNFPELFEYFNKSCLKRINKWAPFVIREYESRTNMAIEAFHKVLKYNFFSNKRNKRCDMLIEALFNYFDERNCEKTLEIRKYSFQNRVAHKFHYIANKSSFEILELGQKSYKLIVIL